MLEWNPWKGSAEIAIGDDGQRYLVALIERGRMMVKSENWTAMVESHYVRNRWIGDYLTQEAAKEAAQVHYAKFKSTGERWL